MWIYLRYLVFNKIKWHIHFTDVMIQCTYSDQQGIASILNIADSARFATR